MPSFNVVNFSLRPNKAIQRSLVFDGLRRLQGVLDLNRWAYVGFGSIWFTDFSLAHQLLRVRDMVSIEEDDIGARRAQFNRPYRTVRVETGSSRDVLPRLCADPQMSLRPWLVWLDYDDDVSEDKLDDVRLVIERAPPNSVVLVTVRAAERRIADRPAQRPQRLRTLFGSVVPDDLTLDDCQGIEPTQRLLADLLLDYMVACAANAGQPAGLVKAFRVLYRDSTPMITVGGVLPARAARPAVEADVAGHDWPSMPQIPVAAPLLTLREVSALQAELPRSRRLSRASVRRLGFDLEDDQIRAFETYYLYYPTFAQINA